MLTTGGNNITLNIIQNLCTVMSELKNKVVYIFSNKLQNECNRLPTMLNRASMVQDLIKSYGLLKHPNMAVVLSTLASEEDLKSFHSSAYIDFMKKVNYIDDFTEYDEDQLEEFGLGYDCPILEKNYDFMRVIAGASVDAAKILVAEKCKTVINWFGGWHHAQRHGAEGFCYVNDVVIAIQKLSEKFEKILYLDLDIHHGNGVQDAFEFSKKVLTLSFHRMEPGFYPGTGAINEVKFKNAQSYSINVPLLNYVGHDSYLKLFYAIFPKIISSFQPKCIVVQCGADGLYGDPIGECNLTLLTIGSCIEKVINLNLPTLYLGGGGYHFANTARLWTYLTSMLVKCDLDNDIPDCSEYFLEYVPTYELHIQPGNLKDKNSNVYTNDVINQIIKICDSIN